jgi:hypothetical protein
MNNFIAKRKTFLVMAFQDISRIKSILTRTHVVIKTSLISVKRNDTRKIIFLLLENHTEKSSSTKKKYTLKSHILDDSQFKLLVVAARNKRKLKLCMRQKKTFSTSLSLIVISRKHFSFRYFSFFSSYCSAFCP